MAFFPDETALLTWMDDSSGLRSVHRNGKGLNAADYYWYTDQVKKYSDTSFTDALVLQRFALTTHLYLLKHFFGN